MEYEEVVRQLAPCGLDCGRCADFRDGEIRRLAASLRQQLGCYERVARLKGERAPLYGDYPAFIRMLEQLGRGPCAGCRSEPVVCSVRCKIHRCHREQGVDYCFQCREYPCADAIDGRLMPRWRRRNDRMKEQGPVAFYRELLAQPRYGAE